MNIRLAIVGIAVLVGVLYFMSRGATPPAELTGVATPLDASWKTDFEAATAEGAKTGKLVMVDFNATWCGPCKLYKSEVFPTAEFKNATKDVILVEVDTDKHPDLAAKYNVEGIPDIRFIAPDGKVVGTVVGYGGLQPLLDELNKAKKAL